MAGRLRRISRLWPYIGGIARKQNEGSRDWWDDRSHARVALTSCDDELCQSGSINQRRLVQMDSRHVCEVQEVRVAIGLRRIQCQRLTSESHNCIHQITRKSIIGSERFRKSSLNSWPSMASNTMRGMYFDDSAVRLTDCGVHSVT
jgi:hypothetical protein